MPGRRVTLMLTVLVICYTSDYVHCRHVACVNQSECIARSCLQCANVDADCQFDNVTNSLHCQPADLAQCNLTECDPVECQHCQGLLFRHDQEWKLKSHCASFDDSACVLGLITDHCVVNNTVTDASVIVARVEGEREFLSVCNCVEENCTQEFVVNYFITPEEIPTPTDSADDECTDSNGGCEHQCTNVDGGYECSCNEGFILSSDGRSCSGGSLRSYSVVIGILCGLVVIGIITAVTIIWIVRRRKNSGGSEHSPPIILTSNEAYVPTGPHA